MLHKRITALLLAALTVAGGAVVLAQGASARAHSVRRAHREQDTSTPIKHLVVIFQENVSFDHYFGTYPNAANPPGEPRFDPARGTPTVNGLSGPLLTNNPNLGNPQRLDRSQPLTCDQNHGYTAEQAAYDMGLMDAFVQNTNNESCSPPDISVPNLVMDYYDGNTVTGLWNYAQHFAMSDNSYSDTFGPSTPGALNVTTGNTFGAICGSDATAVNPPQPSCPASDATATPTPGHPQAQGPGAVFDDDDPAFDMCSSGTTIGMGGQNIGDLLNQQGITWGWFQGGFAGPNYVPGQPSTDTGQCTGTHKNVGGATQTDYSPHHEPFQYFLSTANPQHLPPTSIAMIGHQDQANHQYDLKDFWAAADSGNLPAVSYLKAAKYQDGHAGYSDPLDEQQFLVSTINRLEKLPSWRSTAVVILYDDSDGWYDHQMGPIVTQSQTPFDALTGNGLCGSNTTKVPSGQQTRCGVGPRQPLLVISPFAKSNFVDGTLTTQASVVQFIEDNWLGAERIGSGSVDGSTGSLNNMFDFSRPQAGPLFLDPATGEPTGEGDGRRRVR
ncbi:MAG TPA: alkaline phosphatase family protein [Solirubrobacteraceae bacterium]|nr:alkaline phosphatase family protein [Solirubrobacteraceae bacterium]